MNLFVSHCGLFEATLITYIQRALDVRFQVCYRNEKSFLYSVGLFFAAVSQMENAHAAVLFTYEINLLHWCIPLFLKLF
jgi:hypothetical protein